MIDFLIVGAGLAGIAFAETARDHQKSFVIFDEGLNNSSKVAAGLYNPVVLKRFSSTYQAQQQLDCMTLFYEKLETRLNIKVNHKLPILRRFFSIEEQNNWFEASDKPSLTDFLDPIIVNDVFSGLSSPYGFGKVMQTGWVNTEYLLKSYLEELNNTGNLVREKFDYPQLIISSQWVTYKNIQARHVIFAEGFGLHSNPHFNHLPLDGTKGELLIIEATDLNLHVIINSSLFILPLGNDLFKVGATYNWYDKTNIPTLEGKRELIDKLNEIITCEYKIISHLAGVRPTVKDRKPLVGTHHIHQNLHVLNGLGTRGVMLAPTMAGELFNHIKSAKPLDRETDIKRFKFSEPPRDRS